MKSLNIPDRINYFISDDKTIRLAFEINIIGIASDEYLTMCGIDLNKNITIVIDFNDMIPSVIIRQNYHHYFGLWWTLENKFRRYLIEMLPTINEKIKLFTKRFHSLLLLKELLSINEESFAIFVSHKYPNIELDVVLDNYYANESSLKDEFKLLLSQININASKLTKSNFITLNIINILKKLIIKAKNKCICCDSILNIEVFRPTSCEKNLCNYQFITFGLGMNIELEIMNNPMSADLLISMTYSSIMSNHRLDPNPLFIKKNDIKFENTF